MHDKSAQTEHMHATNGHAHTKAWHPAGGTGRSVMSGRHPYARMPPRHGGWSMPHPNAGWSMPHYNAGWSMPHHNAGWSMTHQNAGWSMPREPMAPSPPVQSSKRIGDLPAAKRSLRDVIMNSGAMKMKSGDGMSDASSVSSWNTEPESVWEAESVASFDTLDSQDESEWEASSVASDLSDGSNFTVTSSEAGHLLEALVEANELEQGRTDRRFKNTRRALRNTVKNSFNGFSESTKRRFKDFVVQTDYKKKSRLDTIQEVQGFLFNFMQKIEELRSNIDNIEFKANSPQYQSDAWTRLKESLDKRWFGGSKSSKPSKLPSFGKAKKTFPDRLRACYASITPDGGNFEWPDLANNLDVKQYLLKQLQTASEKIEIIENELQTKVVEPAAEGVNMKQKQYKIIDAVNYHMKTAEDDFDQVRKLFDNDLKKRGMEQAELFRIQQEREDKKKTFDNNKRIRALTEKANELIDTISEKGKIQKDNLKEDVLASLDLKDKEVKGPFKAAVRELIKAYANEITKFKVNNVSELLQELVDAKGKKERKENQQAGQNGDIQISYA